jgi:hypothetical protein
MIAAHGRDRHGVGLQQALVFRALDANQFLQRLRRVARYFRFHVLGHETDARTGMLENVAKLRAMQLRVRRHAGKPGMHDPEHDRDIVGLIFGDDGDAVAVFHAERKQSACEFRGPQRECAIVVNRLRTEADRRRFGNCAPCGCKPKREIH